ncbi:hypothetical protein EJB05_00472, partial [Eragrostis curvula]
MPIEIDWKEVLVDRSDPPLDVEFTPSPAPRARAGRAKGKRDGDEEWLPRPNTRFGGLGRDGGAGKRGGRKAGGDVRRGTDSATDVFAFGDEDAAGESMSRKWQSPLNTRKKNYAQLGTNSGRSMKHFGSGERKPIPVDKMYSSRSCSTTFTGHQQRVHAIDPEESDHARSPQSQSYSFSKFTKRRKEQHQDSSSLFTRKVQDVVLLDDEDMQPEEIVDCGTPDKQIESKIYYPSRDDPEAVELSSSDIKCLEPGVYLSSPVINYYIQYIKRTKLSDEKFYIFNTYFYSKLEEALVRTSDFLKLRRWWKGVNIFHRAYIILPIHGMAHWSLIIICIPGKESNSGPIILHLDSLGMHSSTKIFDTIKRYLEEEWHHLKKNPPPDTSISKSIWEDLPRNIHTQIVQVPQQNNAYDCGIFMLYYVERFVREAPERFTRDNLGMFSRTWFNSEDASELRLRIQALLLEEFESARLDDALSEAATSDGSDIEDITKGGELEAVTPSSSSEMVIEGVQSGDGGKNDEGFKVAAAEQGSGESGGTGKSNIGIKEIPALDDAPTDSTRHDVKTLADCVLSEAATFSDEMKDEDPVKAYSDSSKAEEEEEEEEFAIVSPDRLKNYVVDDSCDSDSDSVTILDVRNRRVNRRNCLII